MKIKFIIIAVLTVMVIGIGVTANAQTDVSALIAQLQAQIAQLQAQLQALIAQQQGGQTWCFTFNKNLKIGDSGPEIDMLATALTKEGLFSTARTYPDFDEYIASAVVQFQEKYPSEILASYNLKHGTGYVGPSTRAKLNALYGCANKVQCVSNADCPATTMVCVPGMTKISSTCVNNKCTQEKCVQSDCQNLYWFDNTSMSCEPQKQFCGTYMYQGLQTFTDQLVCKTTYLQQHLSQTPSINVISPNGGETWKVGETHNITWQAVGLTEVYITLTGYNANTNFLSTVIANVPASQGSYAWTVPTGLSGSNYKISVYTDLQKYIDSSDNYFTITAATTAKCVGCADVDGNGGVNLGDSLIVRSKLGKCSGDADYNVKYDINGNGCIDDDDVQCAKNALGIGTTTCSQCLKCADVDGNGGVNLGDSLIIRNNLGKCAGDAGFDAKYDINGNGCIGLDDSECARATIGTICSQNNASDSSN